MSGPTPRYWHDDDQRSDKYDLVKESKGRMKLNSAWSRESICKSLGQQNGVEVTTGTGYHVRANHFSSDPDVIQVIIYSPDYQKLIVCDNNVPTGDVDAFIERHTQ